MAPGRVVAAAGAALVPRFRGPVRRRRGLGDGTGWNFVVAFILFGFGLRRGQYELLLHARMLQRWDEFRPKFVKVYPNDYRRVVETQKRYRLQGLADDEAVMAAFEENAHDLARVGGK